MIKGSLQDIDGKVWEKSGEFGILAIETNDGNVEVDFTSNTPDRIARGIATMLLVAESTIPGIVNRIIELYILKKKSR